MQLTRFPFLRRALVGLVAVLVLGTAAYADHNRHHSSPFQGVKANTGSVMHYRENGKSILELSDDFVVPDTPDPHWQVVDTKGEVHLLQALKLKPGLPSNRKIVLPGHVPNVVKVQIWCAFAQTLLGEASFPSPVK